MTLATETPTREEAFAKIAEQVETDGREHGDVILVTDYYSGAVIDAKIALEARLGKLHFGENLVAVTEAGFSIHIVLSSSNPADFIDRLPQGAPVHTMA